MLSRLRLALTVAVFMLAKVPAGAIALDASPERPLH